MATIASEDEAFVRSVLADPADLTTRLAYADWLDDRADPRADFVRLDARRDELTHNPEHADWARLGELGTALAADDPGWVAVMDRPPVENCPGSAAPLCPGRWDGLQGTSRPDVRCCGGCGREVYYCHSVQTARLCVMTGGRVAVRSGLRREPDDLQTPAAEVEAWADLFTDPRIRLRPAGTTGGPLTS